MRISDWSSDVCSSDLASHHRERTGRWEANDLYFVIFAMPSILLLLGGVQWQWGDWATAMGAGIAAYGAIYLGFHDIIVHRRVGHRHVPRSAYMKRIVQAHRLHHAVETRSEEHTSELQSLMRISYAVFCLKKKRKQKN